MHVFIVCLLFCAIISNAISFKSWNWLSGLQPNPAQDFSAGFPSCSSDVRSSYSAGVLLHLLQRNFTFWAYFSRGCCDVVWLLLLKRHSLLPRVRRILRLSKGGVGVYWDRDTGMAEMHLSHLLVRRNVEVSSLSLGQVHMIPLTIGIAILFIST